MESAEHILLNQIPDEINLTHKFSSRFNRKMKALLKYEKRNPFMRRLIYCAKIAVAVLLLVISISTLSVKAYQEKIIYYLNKVWEELTSILIISTDNTNDDVIMPVESDYIPNGYTEIEHNLDSYSLNIIYANNKGNEIIYSQKLLTQGEFIYDTENAIIESNNIAGVNIEIIYNKNTIQCHWKDTYHSYFIIGTVEKEEILRMVKNILEKK